MIEGFVVMVIVMVIVMVMVFIRIAEEKELWAIRRHA